MEKTFKFQRHRSFISTIVALILFGDVVRGIPLPVPFRDGHRDQNPNQRFSFNNQLNRGAERHHQHQPHQIPVPRNIQFPPPGQAMPIMPDEHHHLHNNIRHKRQDERPMHHVNNYGQQQPVWRYANNNDHYNSREYAPPVHHTYNPNRYQNSPLSSGYGDHNNHHQERRDVPYIVQLNDHTNVFSFPFPSSPSADQIEPSSGMAFEKNLGIVYVVLDLADNGEEGSEETHLEVEDNQ